jgi:hypothetical protein
MAHVITFSTRRFDPANERPNPINPIAGEGVLKWLCGKLAGTGYTASEPDTEDWGWYVYVEGPGSRYLVGASGEPEPGAEDVEWFVQVDPQRSLKEKLTGKNKPTADDPLAALLERFVRGEPDFRDVRVESKG